MKRVRGSRPILLMAFAVMAVFDCGANSAALASGFDNAMVNGLRDLRKVSVTVDSRGDAVKQFGFDKTRLRNDVVEYLKKEGLSVDDGDTPERESEGGVLNLQTVMMVIKAGNGSPLGVTYAVDGYLTDVVSSKTRSKAKSILGITWKASGHHGYVNMGNLSKVSVEIFNVVKEFTKDWQLANVAKKASVAKPVLLAKPQDTSVSNHTLKGGVMSDAVMEQRKANSRARQIAAARQRAIQIGRAHV